MNTSESIKLNSSYINSCARSLRRESTSESTLPGCEAKVTDGWQYQGEPEAFEKKTLGDWTLFRLDPQDNGELRWSIGHNGPSAYLTCDEDTAVMILKALSVFDYVKTSILRK